MGMKWYNSSDIGDPSTKEVDYHKLEEAYTSSHFKPAKTNMEIQLERLNNNLEKLIDIETKIYQREILRDLNHIK